MIHASLEVVTQCIAKSLVKTFQQNILAFLDIVFVKEMNGFQYRVPGNHGKEQYHLALNDLHKKYGPLVREVIVQLSRLLYSPIFCGKRKAVY